jgi:hypothetical protein
MNKRVTHYIPEDFIIIFLFGNHNHSEYENIFPGYHSFECILLNIQ